MPNQKNTVRVGVEEKNIYRIFKDLEKYGKTVFDHPDPKINQGVARSIGIRTKDLQERGLFIAKRNYYALPNGIVLKSKNGNEKAFFHFEQISPDIIQNIIRPLDKDD